jgi:hypothetical protein
VVVTHHPLNSFDFERFQYLLTRGRQQERNEGVFRPGVSPQLLCGIANVPSGVLIALRSD